MEEIQTILSKLHQGTASGSEVKRFTERVRQHGRYLEDSEMNAFLEVVFITVRNVLKRPEISALERMYLLDLLEFRARGWAERNSAKVSSSIEKVIHAPEAGLTDGDASIKSKSPANKTEEILEPDTEDISFSPIERSTGEWFVCIVNLKHNHVGAVLGRKGCRIDAIRKYAHVRINLEQSHEYMTADSLRKISLSGQERNIRRAIILLKLLIKGEELPEEVFEYAEEIKRRRQFAAENSRSGLGDSGSRSPDTDHFDTSSVSSWDEDSSFKSNISQPSNQTPVQTKQLSDSGHHEDLSPTDKDHPNEKEDQQQTQRSMYTKHIPVKGHRLKLVLDDEKLLEEIADLIRGQFGDANWSSLINLDAEETKSDVAISNKTSNGSSFPLARGRARPKPILEERIPEPKPHGLAERVQKKSLPFQGFACAIKELKRQVERLEVHEKPVCRGPVSNWQIDDARNLTSTPAVSHARSVTYDSRTIGAFSTSPIESSSVADVPVEPEIKVKIEPEEKTHSDLVPNWSVMGRRVRVIREPINPFTPINVILAVEEGMPFTSLCSAKRRELFTSSGKSSTYKWRTFDVPKYSRDDLMRYSKSHFTKTPPIHWALLTKLFPLVCLKEPWRFPIGWRGGLVSGENGNVVRRRYQSEGEPLNDASKSGCLNDDIININQVGTKWDSFQADLPQADTKSESTPSDQDEIGNGNPVMPMSGARDFMVYHSKVHVKAEVAMERNTVVDQFAESSSDQKMCPEVPESVSISSSRHDADAVGATTAEAVERYITEQESVPAILDSKSFLSGQLIHGTDETFIKTEETVRSIESAASTSGSPESIVSKPIDSFQQGISALPNVQHQPLPGITWSRWGVRPKGVKESVAEVIPQPSVSILSKSNSGGEISVKKIDPYCMEELLSSLCEIEKGKNVSS